MATVPHELKNCCHLVDILKTPTGKQMLDLAWKINKKNAHTWRSRILIRIKKTKTFFYFICFISYMNLQALKAIEASDSAMIIQLKAFSLIKKSPKLHHENWYAAYVLSNSTALMRQITTTCKWSVFVLCNMWEKKEYQWVCILCFTEIPSLYVYVHVKYVKLKWVSLTLRLHVQMFSISPPNLFFFFLIQVIITPMYCNGFFFPLIKMYVFVKWLHIPYFMFHTLCSMYDFTL